MGPSIWHFEVWDRNGNFFADFAGRSKVRRIRQSRNEAEDIYWQVSASELMAYAARLGVDPAGLIIEGQSEVRIRHGRTYVCGGIVQYVEEDVLADSHDLVVRASGFLNLFKARKTDAYRQYLATQATDIAWSLINESQSRGPLWDFGVRRGLVAAVGLHDREYKDDEIKASLQNLTGVRTAPFDFEFTADKLFNTYASMGGVRDDIVLEYPGNLTVPLILPGDASEIRNRIEVLGSGSGQEGSARSTVEDLPSQDNYRVMQGMLLDSSVEDQATLQDNGRIELARKAFPVRVPRLTVGLRGPAVTDYGIGDWVRVKAIQPHVVREVDGMFRIQARDISIDENDNETVSLEVSQ